MDVQRESVVFYDWTLDKTNNGRGEIRNNTLERIRKVHGFRSNHRMLLPFVSRFILRLGFFPSSIISCSLTLITKLWNKLSNSFDLAIFLKIY
ncbi:hypothetical protein [Marinisporobacter balticus]|uniref:Uncharacterized protein n=1 Tax=Marinisporobacter balticus TaxID=2018667 RepID=A0A4R2K6U9_9FIRM|nr:hypothetical protein [Marinisporobacter balticus]TCO67587.1 hypothetical protein EV214_1633 [Marinisporobacter balticus]